MKPQTRAPSPPFLPVSREELNERNIEELDFVLVTGDAYVDHPSFGAALIGRLLESRGYSVGILAQPDWRNPAAFRELGRPSLAFLITGGNLDSMLSNYTAAKKPRRKDAYSPGGIGGKRPDRASIVYANRCREAYKGVPVILGGIEASLRRFAHYDFWEDRVRRSVLFDSRADLLVYGMGERPILEIARRLKEGEKIEEISGIPGTARIISEEQKWELEQESGGRIRYLPSFDRVSQSKEEFAQAFLMQEEEQNPFPGKTLVQQHADRLLVQYPPSLPASSEEMDDFYALPFRRESHPRYDALGGVPALEEVRFSITSHRGCFGGCSFCALTFHQGKIIQSRSEKSIMEEAKLLTTLDGFKGYIHDVGGPTANFRNSACKKMDKRGPCKNKQCLHPEPCEKLDANHRDYTELLRKMRGIPGIKKVFVRSGIRYDFVLSDPSHEFLEELCEHHVSGQLKVAPEHASPAVLDLMGKPPIEVYEKFKEIFDRVNKKVGKEQYLVPYLMSSHPGSTLRDAVALAEKLRDWGYTPEQVQDFIPTPGSLSTCMYHTGLDPRTGKAIHVPKTAEEKSMQRALLQYKNPANRSLVEAALRKAGRQDLMGHGERSLLHPPRKGGGSPRYGSGPDKKKNPKIETGKEASTRNRKPTGHPERTSAKRGSDEKRGTANRAGVPGTFRKETTRKEKNRRAKKRAGS